MADATQGGAPKKKLSTQEILAAARAEAGQAAPAAVESAVGETASVPASEAASPQAPAVETTGGAKTGGEKAPVVEKKAPPAAGAGPKSTSDILARARAEAAQKGASAAPAAAESAVPAESKKPAAAKPAAGGGKSTADILAAARAAAGAKSAAAPAPGAAAAKPAAKEKPAAAAKAAAVADDSGPKLSVQEMLAAVRPGGPPAAPKAEAPAGPPPAPQKPLPSKKPAAASQEQLGYFAAGMATAVAILLSPFFLAWMLLAGTAAIAGLATARFMLPNVLAEPPSKFKIGPPTDFDLGTVATKLVAQYGVWIVHTDQYQGKNLIYALISVCTHLGCTPSWLEGEQKFKCPCHGSGFYITGINFEGPAPRPLERAAIRLAPDGMLEVDKSVKFQEEMGQWADPTSYFEVVA